MSFLKFLSGPPPEKLEQKGDTLIDSGLWGDAKLEYERALEKAKKENRLTPEWEVRLCDKIAGAKESLAASHQQTARDLMEGGYFDDAGYPVVDHHEYQHDHGAYDDGETPSLDGIRAELRADVLFVLQRNRRWETTSPQDNDEVARVVDQCLSILRHPAESDPCASTEDGLLDDRR